MTVARGVLFVLVCAWTSIAHAQPTIRFRSRELGEGRNFIKTQIAVPEVAEAGGQITYSYPIELPQGRGVTPKVELQYSSGSRLSEFGMGWELTLPTIARTQRLGVADYSGNLFVFRDGQATQELVPTGVTTPNGATEYKERVERTFQRYLFYSSSNQWRVLTAGGIRYELGTGNASRRGSNVNLGPAGTAEWLVTRIIDTNSNYVSYEYAPGATRAARISTIRYTGNAATGLLPLWTVSFQWSQHLDAKAQGFRSGFQRLFGGDQLDSIIVNVPRHSTTNNPAAVPASSPETRTYRFTYSDINSPTDAMFYLLSAQVVGMPPVTFTYANPSNSALNDSETIIDATEQDYPGHLGFTASASDGSSMTRSALVDATGDARADLVQATSPDDGLWTVWTNEGDFLNRTFWNAPIDLVDKIPDNHALRVALPGDRVVQDFIDLDGDGFPDLVWLVATGGGPLIKYCPGNGHGFETCTPYGAGAPGTAELRRTDATASADTNVTVLDLADMNGDGLADVLKLAGTQLQVYRNRGPGVGFEQTPLVSIMPSCPVSLLAPACLRATQNVLFGSGNRRQVADLRDVNGDGLVDFVVNDVSTNEFKIAYGDGRSFRPFIATGTFHSIGLGRQETASGTGDYSSIDDMVDMNGDGLADFIEMDCVSNSYSIWFNNGGVWDATPRVHQASAATAGHVAACGDVEEPAKVDSETGVWVRARLLDFNGDGNVDFVSAPLSLTFPPAIRVGQQTYRAPRLILSASSLNSNHQLNVTWDAPTGSVPVPVHVPVSVTRSITPLYGGQSTRSTTTTTTYTFEGGSFDRGERAFAGFFTVTAVGPPWGVTVQTVYGTTLAQRGLILTKSTWNNLAQGIQENVTNFYTYVNLGAGRTFAQLDKREEGPPPTVALPVPTATTLFQNYDAFGHPQRWVEYGRVLVSGDEYVNERDYATRIDEDFMLSVIVEERRQAGTTISATAARTRKYYDNHVTFGIPPTAGNVVKVQRDLDSTHFATTEFFYDANGNVTQELDESGYSTTYGYDPTYARFRVSETNSIGTTFRSFHALSASQADECGPQYSGTSYRCSRVEVDVFGREISSWVPVLNGATYTLAQLTSTTYQDNAYPLSTTIVKRGIAHAVQYRDGFGNPIQMRIEETSGLYRVYDSSLDAEGRAYRVEQVYRENGMAYAHAPPSNEAWTYVFDAVHGTIERVTHPRNAGQGGLAATASRIIGPERTVFVDEDGREIDYLQDAYRRVTSAQRYANGAHNDTQFVYDSRGDVVSVTDSVGNTTVYGRNLVGWITSITPPGSSAFTYTYDPRGLVATTLDQRGVTVVYTYDPAGRLTNVTSSGGPAAVRQIDARLIYYNASTDTRQIGWLQNETSDSITQTYSYTPEHAIATHRSARGTMAGTVAFGYDIGSRLNHVSYPDGNAATFAYDLADEPTVVRKDSSQAVLAAYLYEDDGQLSVVTNDFGLDESNTYDARGRRIAMVSTNTSVQEGPLVDDAVTLSAAGDVLSLVRAGLRPGRVVRTTPDVFTMTMDPFHQLTRVDRNGALFAQYSYDGAGRLTSFNETGTTTTSTSTYSYDLLLERVTGGVDQTLTYDQAGDVISDTLVDGGTSRQRTHYWDALQRYSGTTVSGGTTTDYYYTPSGRLSRVIAPSELPSNADNLYVGDWARLDMSSGMWTDQLNANGMLVMEMTAGRFEMPHRTLQQTVAAVTDDQGNVIRQEEFAPFGMRSAGTPDGRFEQHFQGVRADELVVAGGRSYDPQMGAWLARDMIHRNPRKLLDDIRLVNGYAFDFSNPYSLRDPSGLAPEDTQVFYAAPKDVVKEHDKKEWRWSIASEPQKKEYERALEKLLRDKHVIPKKGKTKFTPISTIRDVSKLADKDFGSLVLVAHGFSDAPAVAVILPNPDLGTKGDATKADEFADLIKGAGYSSIAIMGCDTVSNKFAPNLAAQLPAGGTVTGYKGDELRITSHFEYSKTTPGHLQLTRMRADIKLQTFKTGPQ